MGIQFFPISSQPTVVLHNNLLSRDLTINRPGFTSAYVSNFDDAVLERAMDWFNTLNKRYPTVDESIPQSGG